MAKNTNPSPIAPEGMAVLLAPDGASGVSYGEVDYAVSNGYIVVPMEAVNLLVESFGYVAAE